MILLKKIKSAYGFFRWEIIKAFRSLQANIDDLTWRPTKPINLDQYLDLQGKRENFQFVQVGANDGITGDRLHSYIKKYGWRGVLVEPVPYLFDRLKNNYCNCENLVFENCAIGKSNGKLLFYSIAEMNKDGERHSQFLGSQVLSLLGSFDKRTLMNHSNLHPQFESFIEEIEVPTITLSELFRKHAILWLQLLQIDTEGYDFEILNRADFSTIKPNIIIFENVHMTRLQYKMLIKKLKRLDYYFYIDSRDTVAVQSL